MIGSKKTIWLIAVFGIALFSGVIGAAIYFYWFNQYTNANSLLVGELTPSGLAANLLGRESKKTVVTQDEKIMETLAAAEKTVVGLVKKSDNKNQLYNLAAPEARALILTSDGWLLTNWRPAGNQWSGYAAVTADKHLYEINSAVTDNFSGFTFLRLRAARGLSVVNFGRAEELTVGQSALSFDWLGRADLVLVSDFGEQPAAVKSSDAPFKKIVLTGQTLPANRLAVWDLGGRVIALVKSDGQAVSANYFINALDNVLTGKPLARTVLGVNYLDLTYFAGGAKPAGAVLTKDKKGVAVVKDSAAAAAGLQAGDIIISLDGAVLDRVHTLADLTANYRPGQKAAVKYWRAGADKETVVTFGQAK